MIITFCKRFFRRSVAIYSCLSHTSCADDVDDGDQNGNDEEEENDDNDHDENKGDDKED